MVTICTASLTLNNSTFCTYSVIICFMWIWEQTAIISIYSINCLVFITETESVYCAVRTECLYVTEDPPDGTPTKIWVMSVLSDITQCCRGRFMKSDGWICDEDLCAGSWVPGRWRRQEHVAAKRPYQYTGVHGAVLRIMSVFVCFQHWEALWRIFEVMFDSAVANYEIFRKRTNRFCLSFDVIVSLCQ